MQVIVFDTAFAKGVINEGETDGKIIDKHYLRVNGELYYSMCVLKNTSEARCAVELVVKANQAAESAKLYASLLGRRLLGQYKVV